MRNEIETPKEYTEEPAKKMEYILGPKLLEQYTVMIKGMRDEGENDPTKLSRHVLIDYLNNFLKNQLSFQTRLDFMQANDTNSPVVCQASRIDKSFLSAHYLLSSKNAVNIIIDLSGIKKFNRAKIVQSIRDHLQDVPIFIGTEKPIADQPPSPPLLSRSAKVELELPKELILNRGTLIAAESNKKYVVLFQKDTSYFLADQENGDIQEINIDTLQKMFVEKKVWIVSEPTDTQTFIDQASGDQMRPTTSGSHNRSR